MEMAVQMSILLAQKQSPCSFATFSDDEYDILGIVIQIMNYLRAGGSLAILNLRLEEFGEDEDPEESKEMIYFKRIIARNTLPEEKISIALKGEPLRTKMVFDAAMILHITLEPNHKEKK